jgi:F-type H+-transporting ATPase subunit gamma
MPSLKDLKNRIESVKSTRKITKAMQMVAAAKLRRAQEAARWPRPYAERFNAVMAGSPPRSATATARPSCWRAPARTDVHLLVVMTAERGLCGGFNSTSPSWRAADRRAERPGQDGQDPDRRQEGPRAAEARLFRPSFRRPCRPERGQAHRLCQRAGHRARRAGPLRRGRVRRGTIFFSKFQSVISQIPTATADHPGQVRGRRG